MQQILKSLVSLRRFQFSTTQRLLTFLTCKRSMVHVSLLTKSVLHWNGDSFWLCSYSSCIISLHTDWTIALLNKRMWGKCILWTLLMSEKLQSEQLICSFSIQTCGSMLNASLCSAETSFEMYILLSLIQRKTKPVTTEYNSIILKGIHHVHEFIN